MFILQIYKLKHNIQTIYVSMVFSESDIRQMVQESISKLLEYHHTIDDGLGTLADDILLIARHGGGTISADVVNRYNKYFQTDKDLKVVVERRSSDNAYYDRINNVLGIATKTLNSVKAKEIVMHELSHFIDQNARKKFDTEVITMPKLRFVDMALYFYRVTEMQARLNEYANRIKRNPMLAKYKITSKQTSLHIDDMYYTLKMVEGADFNNSADPSWAMVIGLAYSFALSKAMRRTNTISSNDVRGRFTNYINIDNLTEQEFNNRKASVSKILRKRLRVFTHKALKIKGDAIQTNQQSRQ